MTWADSWSDPDVKLSDAMSTEWVCTSVGYLVRDTDEVVTIAQTQDGEGWHEVLSIPRAMVREVTRLEADSQTVQP